jgi:siroheme synthase-like protein
MNSWIPVFTGMTSLMKYYPVYLDLKAKSVLVVGGGTVALQKIPALLEGEAQVHLVSPEALPEIEQLAVQGRITWSRRGYQREDLDGASLVIAATDDPELQKRVASEARARRIWVNVVDVPPLCDFIAPAIVSRGEIQIAISTGGAAPALAKFLRQKLEPILGPEYAEFVEIVRRHRPEILKLKKEKRMSLWECIVSEPFFEQIRREGPEKAEARLKEWIHAASAA